jgi:hypothetical protein
MKQTFISFLALPVTDASFYDFSIDSVNPSDGALSLIFQTDPSFAWKYWRQPILPRFFKRISETQLALSNALTKQICPKSCSFSIFQSGWIVVFAQT